MSYPSKNKVGWVGKRYEKLTYPLMGTCLSLWEHIPSNPTFILIVAYNTNARCVSRTLLAAL